MTPQSRWQNLLAKGALQHARNDVEVSTSFMTALSISDERVDGRWHFGCFS